MNTYHKTGGNSLINLVIGLSLLIFVVILAWFVFKIVLGLAPLIGVLITIGGGIWYLQADNEHQKLRALQTAFAGIVVMIVFGIIF